MNTRHGYPPARPRVGGAVEQTAEKYGRYQSTEAFVALGDTDTDVIVFAGKPDSIVLTARVADALVTLSDRLGRETHELIVLAGETQETHISREQVVARERVAAGGSELFVVGKWAESESPA